MRLPFLDLTLPQKEAAAAGENEKKEKRQRERNWSVWGGGRGEQGLLIKAFNEGRHSAPSLKSRFIRVGTGFGEGTGSPQSIIGGGNSVSRPQSVFGFLILNYARKDRFLHLANPATPLPPLIFFPGFSWEKEPLIRGNKGGGLFRRNLKRVLKENEGFSKLKIGKRNKTSVPVWDAFQKS
ncbi:hypothetical protein CEXT_334011 [Caerostris extrusa]|uniref:Uncharacterized protein n=1 Tax=Caerostris extrusa TaxID=172846 RepID=A0AAV4XWI2_CAEEX|nr:hypothetical protein CEXT_334011 [Caerostris extrusa]